MRSSLSVFAAAAGLAAALAASAQTPDTSPVGDQPAHATAVGAAPSKAPILLSPVFGLVEPRDLVAWLLESGLKARLNLQVHKVIWPPDTRGV